MQTNNKTDTRVIFICPHCGGHTRSFRGVILGGYAEGEWCKSCGPKSIYMTPEQRSAWERKREASDESPN